MRTCRFGVALLLIAISLPAQESADAPAELERGVELLDRNEPAEAVPALENALRAAGKTFGADHPEIALYLETLGVSYARTAQPNRAEPLFFRSDRILDKKWGPQHFRRGHSVRRSHDHAIAFGGKTTVKEMVDEMRLWLIDAKPAPPGSPAEQLEEALDVGRQFREDNQDAAALVHLTRALDLAGKLYNAKSPQWPVFLRRLQMELSSLDGEQTLPLYLRIIKIRETISPTVDADLAPFELAETLIHVADIHQRKSRWAEAEALLLRAIKSQQGTGNNPLLPGAVYGLADVYRQMKQPAKAEAFLTRHIALLETENDQYALANASAELGLLYQLMQQPAKADAFLKRSVKIQETTQRPDEFGYQLRELGKRAQKLGLTELGEGYLQRGLKIKSALQGVDHFDLIETLDFLADLHLARNDLAKATPYLQRIVRIYESHPKSVDDPGRNEPEDAARQAAVLRAAALLNQGDVALQTADGARRRVRQLVARVLPLLSEQEQLKFLQQTDEKAFEQCLTAALLQKDSPRAAELSAGWILNGKATAQEVLGQRSTLARSSADPAAVKIAAGLETVRAELAQLALGPRETRAEVLAKAAKLSESEQDLSRQLALVAGRSAGDPWAEVAAVRKALAADTILVEFARVTKFDFVTKKPLPACYVAWLIPPADKGAVQCVDLGDAEPIDAAVQAWRKGIADSPTTIAAQGEADAEAELRKAADVLAKRIFAPLVGTLKAYPNWLLSPDDALWLVPWAALPLDDKRYVVEAHRVAYTVTGRNLVTMLAPHPATPPAIVADPDFDLTIELARAETGKLAAEQPPALRGVRLRSVLPQVARLPGTAAEARAIQPSLNQFTRKQAKLFAERTALEGVVKRMQSPQVAVLSTHGFFISSRESAENPLLRCGLLLAGCNRRGAALQYGDDDGVLTGLEILGLDLRGTELVVLSACESGLGDTRAGEGVAGLRQAFQLAGAQSVAATLWQIPDRETAKLMSDFFDRLAQGMTKPDALRAAQQAMIAARREKHGAAHPHYWAAFTMTGGESPIGAVAAPEKPPAAPPTPAPLKPEESSAPLAVEEKSFKAHDGTVLFLAISADGRRAATTGGIRRGKEIPFGAKLWDLETAAELKNWDIEQARSVAFSPDGLRLAIGCGVIHNGKEINLSAQIRDLASDTEVRRFDKLVDGIEWIGYSPDGKRLLARGRYGGGHVWDTDSGREVFKLPLPIEFQLGTGYEAVAISPDGRLLLAATKVNPNLYLFDAKTGKLLRDLSYSAVIRDVQFSADGRRAFTLSGDGRFLSWDTTTWDPDSGFPTRDSAAYTEVTAISPSGRAITRAYPWQSAVRVWDIEFGKELCQLSVPKQPTSAVAITPDGRRALSAHSDGTVRLWTLPK